VLFFLQSLPSSVEGVKVNMTECRTGWQKLSGAERKIQKSRQHRLEVALSYTNSTRPNQAWKPRTIKIPKFGR